MPTNQPVLKTISDGGLVVHLHDYRVRRHSLVPICRPRAWMDKVWVEDDGCGAQACERCAAFHASRRAQVYQNALAKTRRNYPKMADHRKQYAKEYRQANAEALRLKRRVRNRVRSGA